MNRKNANDENLIVMSYIKKKKEESGDENRIRVVERRRKEGEMN